MALDGFHAFTVEHKGRVKKLLSRAKLVSGGQSIDVTALWDTGATCTAISTEVVKRLGLPVRGKDTIKTPSGSKQVQTYLVDIGLPNNVIIHNVNVCDSDIGEQSIDLLIGMNIISLGDFAVSNYEGKTNFSFRIPSQRAVDYRAAAVWGNNMVKSHSKRKAK